MGDNLPPVSLTFGDGAGVVSNVFAERYHTCVSGTEEELACFGINNGGQLGAETDDTALGDEPNEVESISSIDLGSDAVVASVPAPGALVPLETISPTPATTAGTDVQFGTFPLSPVALTLSVSIVSQRYSISW